MKILIFSDSHGRMSYMQRALDMHPDCEYVIHLGDGVADGEYVTLPKRAVFIGVRGNCDAFSQYPEQLCERFSGIDVMILHGHKYCVKSSLAIYEKYAQSQGVKVALYGHTHKKDLSYKDGIYYFNPGSIGKYTPDGYTYGIMTVRGKDILLSHGKVE